MIRICVGICILILLLCRVASAASANDLLKIVVPEEEQSSDSIVYLKGNLCEKSESLREVMRLDENTSATPAMAEIIRIRLLDYLRQRGYSLARVWTKLHRDRIFVTIDEGKLEKIIIRGPDALRTSLMHLTIELPNNVYNKYRLGESIEALKQSYDIEELQTEIVESPAILHYDWQINEMGLEWFGEAAGYELHIIIGASNSEGPSLGLSMQLPHGVVPKLQYVDYDLIFEKGDRFNAGLETGYMLRKSLNTDDYNLDFTHAKAFIRYDYPRIAGLVRFYNDAYIDLSKYQRTDLPLDSYWDLTGHISLNIGLDFEDSFTIYVGAAAEWKNIFSIVKVKDDDFDAKPLEHWRGIVSLGLHYDWTPEQYRLDRHSDFNVEVAYHLVNVSEFYRFRLDYQHLFPIGYHDFLIRTSALYSSNPIPYYDEISLVGDLLRTSYSESFYVEMALWVSLEFRGSIYRDIIKLSIYHDIALFDKIDHGSRPLMQQDPSMTSFAWANSFGPGFHWLIIDTFQFDIYAAFGFSPAGFDVRPYFRFRKVF